jgi:uncharacterized protein (DUF302 family)
MSSPETPLGEEREAAGNVAATVAKLRDAARGAGLTVFAEIDHAAGAREAGLDLPDEVVVVLGSPQVGTAVMQAAPRAGLDLPLRVLVWDDEGTTRITWRDPRLLAREHPLDGRDDVLAKMAAGLAKVVSAAT